MDHSGQPLHTSIQAAVHLANRRNSTGTKGGEHVEKSMCHARLVITDDNAHRTGNYCVWDLMAIVKTKKHHKTSIAT